LPEQRRVDLVGVDGVDPDAVAPQPLPGSPPPTYGLALRDQPGEVWLSYVVQPDSTADPKSIRVLLADNASLADAVFALLAIARGESEALPSRRVCTNGSCIVWRTEVR